jgi:hypothetical protein
MREIVRVRCPFLEGDAILVIEEGLVLEIRCPHIDRITVKCKKTAIQRDETGLKTCFYAG